MGADCREKYCHIELLGTLRVVRGGETITHFPRQKAARLLSYLALNLRQPHPRERLVDLFWPDLDLPAGRDSLSTTLTALRRLLEPPGIGRGGILTATHQHIGLNPAAVTTDVLDFERLIGAAGRETHAVSRAGLLSQAVALYRGEALAGIYDDWATLESQRLQCLFVDALRGWTGTLEEMGNDDEARRAASRWVAADLYAEEAHVCLITLHARTGHSGDARAAAQHMAHLWQEEFGSPLSAASQAEIVSILAMKPGSSGKNARAASQKPARAVLAPPVPLPLPLDSFFGRETELTWLANWLEESVSRLATLIGPGGMGKTRLALEFAQRAGGRFICHFVSLAEIQDSDQILPAIVRALALPPDSPAPMAQIAAALETNSEETNSQHTILILDNMEQLVAGEEGEAARLIQALLHAVPQLSCLCTSRLSLSLRGEQLIPVEPLPLPSEIAATSPSEEYADMEACASVRLYVNRARMVRPDFSLTPENAPSVVTVCRLLDGSPLALELAASWVRLLPPRAMQERLARQTGMIALEARRFDAPARHHSLRAALDWSWRLLRPEEQRLLACLSVFRGGWTLEAAENVCAAPNALELLASLIQASLVTTRQDAAGEVRYGLLETIRHYAAHRLTEMNAGSAAHGRHLAWFITLAKRADVEICLAGAQQQAALAQLDADHDNLRAALDWAAQEDLPAAPDAAGDVLTLTTTLGAFWRFRGYIQEGHRRLVSALARQDAQAPTSLRANALDRLGILSAEQGNLAAAQALFEESVEVRRTLGDRSGEFSTLNNLAIVLYDRGNHAGARSLWEEVLALVRASDAASGMGGRCEAHLLTNLGELEFDLGNIEAARRLLEEALALNHVIASKEGIAYTLALLGNIAHQQGDLRAAHDYLRESLPMHHALGHRLGVAQTLEATASLAMTSQQADLCVSLLGAAAALREEIAIPLPANETARHETMIAAAQAALGAEAFEKVFTAGRKMNWEQTTAQTKMLRVA